MLLAGTAHAVGAATAARPPADALAFCAVVYGVVLTAWTGASVVRGSTLSAAQHGAAVVLGLATAALAVAYARSLALGHRPSSVGTTLGYCGAALLLLPLAWPKDAAALTPRMAAGTACLAALAVTVVVLRLRVTW